MKGRAAAFVCALLGLGLAAGVTVLPLTEQRQAIAPAPPAKPQRIMSTNLCSDLLLLMLVPKERIASVTHLAHPAVQALLPGRDAGVPINHGTAEEVVQQQPDLILGSPWSASTMRRLARIAGARVAEIEPANSFDDIRRITREVGALVGEPQRAETLIAEMDDKLAALSNVRAEHPFEVVAWSADNGVPGQGTLTDEIIRAAGATNLAARTGEYGFSSFGIEELLLARPDAILRGEGEYGAPSLSGAASEHRLLREAFRGRRISYPVFLHTCGLPQSADAAVQLNRALTRLPPGELPW